MAGGAWGRVKALIDHQGRRIKEAGPSTPVQVRLVAWLNVLIHGASEEGTTTILAYHAALCSTPFGGFEEQIEDVSRLFFLRSVWYDT